MTSSGDRGVAIVVDVDLDSARLQGIFPRILELAGFAAMLLLDGRKCVIGAVGQTWDGVGDGLEIRNGHLVGTDRASDAHLQQALDQALRPCASSAVAPSLVCLKRPVGRPLLARVLAVADERRPALGQTALAVVVTDPDRPLHPSEQVLMDAFQLTPAEARVARQLARAETVDQIAERQQVSVGTVRVQMKAVFAKTETRRQAELVGLLARTALICDQAP